MNRDANSSATKIFITTNTVTENFISKSMLRDRQVAINTVGKKTIESNGSTKSNNVCCAYKKGVDGKKNQQSQQQILR